ncbi:FG-GAP-like repeat-containing protein [Paenarthrobacter sp. NPDC056912]|uniref:FG-GAP-like repeat-containing protein n=1 Tax=Paenarthrobacter sp. NPDC056912 TaxID=3345965 RepID=UPI00367118A7
MNAPSCLRSGVRRAAAGIAAAIFAAVVLTPAPAMATMDPEPPVISGAPYVGSTLTVTWDPYAYKGCGAGAGPDTRIYWTRDGEVATDHPTWPNYVLTEEDRDKTIAAHLVAAYPCEDLEVASEETAPISASHRPSGFTGRSAFELLARRSDGALLMYPRLNNTWESARTVGAGWNIFPTVFSPGDFDGDGVNDVLGRDSAGGLYLYSGNGDGGWTGPRKVGTGWNIFTSLVSPGDFNSDGTNDVLARDSSGLLYLYPGDGHGGWLPRSVVGQGWNALNAIVTPGDFDGDTNVDVLARDSAGNLKLYRGDGLGGWNGMSVVGQGWSGMSTIGSAGDINADGKLDIFAVDGSGQLRAYYGNGSGGWAGAGVVGWGWNGFTALF